MRSVGVFYMAVALFLGCSQHYEEGAHPSPKPPQPAPMPTGHPPVQNQASSGEAVVSGTIQLGVDIQSRLVKNAALFIIARPAPVGGPPLAVKRLDVPSFPYKYTLKQSDAMMAQGLDWSEIDALYLSCAIRSQRIRWVTTIYVEHDSQYPIAERVHQLAERQADP